MHSYAIIPPILQDEHSRRYQFENNNGLLENAMAHYKDRLVVNFWTPPEVEIYKEKYLQHPKNFGFIATSLDRKVSLHVYICLHMWMRSPQCQCSYLNAVSGHLNVVCQLLHLYM